MNTQQNFEQQRSIGWFEKRKGKITGSIVGAILGLSPFKKEKEVLRDLVRAYHGAESEFKGNIATEYGNKNEPVAIKNFELETGKEVIETGFHIHPILSWLGASPDGLVGDNAIIEIKCPYGKRRGESFNSIQDQLHYYAQMQIEMNCTGRKLAIFYQW